VVLARVSLEQPVLAALFRAVVVSDVALSQQHVRVGTLRGFGPPVDQFLPLVQAIRRMTVFSGDDVTGV
jgi:hypothetical protein